MDDIIREQINNDADTLLKNVLNQMSEDGIKELEVIVKKRAEEKKDEKRVLVKGIYWGVDGIRGYNTGLAYEIYITWYNNFVLLIYPKNKGTGAENREYINLATFLKDWPTITLINETENG